MDEDDPTLNNPALDLEDSDADDEWTPIKEKVEFSNKVAELKSWIKECLKS